MHKDQDIEYLIRLKSGDQEGLRFFMRLWGEQLRFYSFKITRNKEVSEEIVSEAFCIAWQNKEKTVSVAALKSYLFLVVRNASYDHTSGYYRKNVDLGDEFLLETPEGRPDILSQIIYVEILEQIIKELERLPKQQAEIFRMTYLEGKSNKEICQTLGTTLNTIYFARSKALSTLRQIFKVKDISLYSAFMMFIEMMD